MAVYLDRKIDTSLERRVRIENGLDPEYSLINVAAWPDYVVRAMVTKVAQEADQVAEARRNVRCVFCKHAIFFLPTGEHGAICVGHVYSEAGMRDVRIVGCCEYCFDNMDNEDDEADAWMDDDTRSINED
jgi:hypothetical protein